MMYVLGIVTGILLTGLSVLIALLFRPQAERTARQLQSKAAPKGAIIEPQSDELEHWLQNLKDENE